MSIQRNDDGHAVRTPSNVITAELSAGDDFSEWFPVRGAFTTSITGTWAGTITLQRRYVSHGGEATTVLTDPRNVATHTANAESFYDEPGLACEYRLGFNGAPAYTSGTALVELRN